MFMGASTDVGGDASVENAVRAVGHDVDPAAGHSRLTAWVAGSSPAMTVAEPDAHGLGQSTSPQLHPVVAPQVSHLGRPVGELVAFGVGFSDFVYLVMTGLVPVLHDVPLRSPQIFSDSTFRTDHSAADWPPGSTALSKREANV